MLALVYDRLGFVLAKNGQFAEAEACFRKAIRNNGKHVGYWNNLAFTLSKQGNQKAVIETLREVLKLTPDDTIALNNLAAELVTIEDPAIRDPAEALQHARRAVKLKPNDASYQDTLSEVAFRAGKWKESLRARREKNKLRPVNVEDELFLCMMHWRLDNREKARTFFEAARRRFHAIPPSTPRLRQLFKEARTLLGGMGSSPRPPVAASRPK